VCHPSEGETVIAYLTQSQSTAVAGTPGTAQTCQALSELYMDRCT